MIPYIGGKHGQSPWLIENAPSKIKQYGEVFGGAMWLYLRSNFIPEVAYYNDIDLFMVNLFSCLKEYKRFIQEIKGIPTFNHEVFEEMKSIVQDYSDENFEIPNFELAVAHVYIIVHVFSGTTKKLWNRDVKMVERRPNTPDFMDNHAIVKRLKKSKIQEKLKVLQISNENYIDFINRIDNSNLFMYIDPPYWGLKNYYRKTEFDEEDHRTLLNKLRTLNCKWMLSYYDFEILRQMLPENEFFWKRKSFTKGSVEVGKGGRKNVGEEIIITNYRKTRPFEIFFQ